MSYVNGVFPDFSALPRMIVRGEAVTLSLNVFVDDSATKDTLASATLTLKQGSTKIVDAQTATVGGSVSASYNLTAGDTSSLSLSDDLLELWTVTTSGGETVTIRRSGHLVRHALFPLVKDSDLVARHNQLNDIRPSGLSNWLEYIKTAWEILNRDLIKRGKRPELVLDSYAIFDLHIYKTLNLIFRDMTTFVGDGRYHEMAENYHEAYKQEFEVVQFHYDSDLDGDIDEEKEAATPSLWLSAPVGWYGGGTWGGL
tara:strand:+ start:863 stop:1630 length:768 start_codon:yes stop_codon:yes gene_type:complete